MPEFILFLFQNGQREWVHGLFDSYADALEAASKHRLDQPSPEEVIRTEVAIGAGARPYRNPRGGFRHKFAAQARSRARVLYFDVIAQKDFEDRCKEGEAAYRRRQTEVQNAVDANRHLDKKSVSLRDLPLKWRDNIRVSKTDCWLWKTATSSPYRRVYVQMKGPVPEAVLLRHLCDDRRCVNPNHLIVGTHADNVADMMERGRHASQKLTEARRKTAAARAKRRLSV